MYSSTILSLRAKGSSSFPFADHSHCPLPNRFDRCGLHFSSSLSASCCCSCCCRCCSACHGHGSAAVNRLLISPTFLYGPRQSSLLQWSASKRLIMAGADRGYCRGPGCGVERDICESSWVFEERNDEGRSKGRRRRKVVRCTVSEENSNTRRLSRFDDAEAVLSLLSEEVCEESFGGRERKTASSPKRMETEKKRIYGSEFSKGRKRNVRLDLAKRYLRHKPELVEIESNEECQSCRTKRESKSRQDDGKIRKDGSSCSSYYSISSSGDFESDTEEIKDDTVEGNLPVASNEDSLVKEQNRIQKEALDKWKRNQEVREDAEVKKWKESTSRSNAEWDWRKKSEKKLDGVSAQQTQSTEESSLIQDNTKVSSSHRKLTGVDGNLDVSVNLDPRGRSSYSQTENQTVGLTELRNKTEKSADVCRVCGSDLALSSKSQELLNMTKENVAVSADFAGEISDSFRKPMKSYPQRASEGVKILEIDSETALKLQESNTRVSNRNESERLTSTSAREREQQKNLQIDERISKRSDKRRSQQFTELSDSRQNVERTHASHKQHQEESINLVSSSVLNSREQFSHTNQEGFYHPKHSREEAKVVTDKSSYQTGVMETASSSQRASEDKMADRRSNITVVVNVGDGVSKSPGQSSQRVMQTETEPRRLTKVLSSPANASRLVDQAQDQVGKDAGSSTVMLIPPPPQVVVQGSAHIGQTSRVEAPQSKYAGARTPRMKTEVEAGDIRDGSYGTPVTQLAHEDALESVQRFDQLSNQVVGEFIEKARQEVLSSEIQTKTSETVLTNQTRTSSSQFDSGVQLTGGWSRDSLEGSGTKGPSDEIWLETRGFAQEPAKAEAEPPEGSVASGQAIVKRSGRSLWNIIADVVRLRWAPRAETPRSAPRSRKKSSSDESVSSEAWFSGREQGSTSLEAITPLHRSQLIGASTGSQAESSLSDKNRISEEQVSSPLTSGSGSASQETSSAYIQEDSGPREHIKQLESGNTPLSTELVKPLTSPTVVEAAVATGEVDLPLGSSMETLQPHGAKSAVVSGKEGKDGELKQRKLQRTRQVPKDRFDEWEEAYKLESEQRKIDEMFMREALIEAKKAADNWEVPVGAVLVQHGKIIARGCNLVEQLRDSTAHAEMICIREASNVLWSWRLADSTLYVTLEPCPMCAGAILQARIDTLVWGAPNKLLGADGSWIRLFPIGEGSSSSETAEKPAPPAHPFHPKMMIRRGVLASECADTMQQFFQLRRRKKEKKPEEPTTPPSCLPVASHPSKLLNRMQDMFHITFCL